MKATTEICKILKAVGADPVPNANETKIKVNAPEISGAKSEKESKNK